jgi:predicted HTH transcriptional regulator
LVLFPSTGFVIFAGMKPHYIHKLIAQGEHQQLDFKFEIADSRKIARTFSAFANTDGGKLLIGVMDNGIIAGIRTEEEKFMAENAVKLYCKPLIEFRSREWIIDGKKILEITIKPGNEKPYYASDIHGKWLAYLRVKDQNVLANRVWVNAWIRKGKPEGTYINYGTDEKLLLEYLESNKSITLAEFRQMTGLSAHKAENILTNFLALDIIEAMISEKEAEYSLTKSADGIK